MLPTHSHIVYALSINQFVYISQNEKGVFQYYVFRNGEHVAVEAENSMRIEGMSHDSLIGWEEKDGLQQAILLREGIKHTLPLPSQYNESAATYIHENGYILGYAMTKASEQRYAIMWVDRQPVDINRCVNSDYIIAEANNMNAHFDIAASAYNKLDDRLHPVLLRPY